MFYLDFVAVSLAVAVVCVTVAQSSLFQPVREWVSGWSSFFGKLINCPYCLAHWVALFTNVWLWDHAGITWAAVWWLALTGLAVVWSGIITKLYGD